MSCRVSLRMEPRIEIEGDCAEHVAREIELRWAGLAEEMEAILAERIGSVPGVKLSFGDDEDDDWRTT